MKRGRNFYWKNGIKSKENSARSRTYKQKDSGNNKEGASQKDHSLPYGNANTL